MSIEELIRYHFPKMNEQEWKEKKNQPPFNKLMYLILDAVAEYHPKWIPYDTKREVCTPRNKCQYLIRDNDKVIKIMYWDGKKWDNVDTNVEYFMEIPVPREIVI